MSLCQLTRTSTSEPIYVNPMQVVAVYQTENGTLILTTATGDGAPHRIQVDEQVSDVVSRLNLHSKD